jgi:hypothetical protein
VEWLLLTSLPIDTVEQVRLVIEWYTDRWMVEMSHPDYPSSEGLYRRDRAA